LATAALTLEFFAAIDERFKLPAPAIPTLDKLPPEQAADMVRHQWGLGDRPISKMIHLLEAKGVRVASLNQEYGDIDAFCFYRDAVPYAILNTSKSAERQRFDAAHELGHLVLHSELDMDPSTSKAREAEANAFAASFLMPRTAVLAQAMAAASVGRILTTRSFWKVSAMAMTHRLRELHLLSDWQYRSTCITLSERGYRTKEPGGFVPETSQLLRKVMYGREARLSARDAAGVLDVYASEIREYVRHLVPMSA
jgi:Zn-dependent peptidase ImmA (M78 family)